MSRKALWCQRFHGPGDWVGWRVLGEAGGGSGPDPTVHMSVIQDPCVKIPGRE